MVRAAVPPRWQLAFGLLLFVAACSHAAPLVSRPADGTRSLVIRNVAVFDAPRAVLLDGVHDVLVRDGRIATIGSPGLVAPGTAELDGHGGTLLPGLIDAHTHTGSLADPPTRVTLPNIGANLAAFLYAGVTTVLDLGSLTPAVFRARAQVADGSLLGPRLYAAGPMITAPGGHPVEVLQVALPWWARWYVIPRATRQVGNAAEGRQAVEGLLPERPDIIKIAVDVREGVVPRLDLDTIASITAAAHAAGIRTIAHIGSSAEAVDAIRGGADALAHGSWRDELSDEAVALLAESRAPVIVTIHVWDLMEHARHSLDDFTPLEREVAGPATLSAWLAAPSLDHEPTLAPFVRAVTAGHDARRRNVLKLRAAGVPILAGSDACNPGDFPGAGLHQEITKLVEAGLTPGEALRAATFENARFLAGASADFGEIAVGKRADLLLVAGDPVTHIADLGRIAHVILDGAVLVRHAPQQ